MTDLFKFCMNPYDEAKIGLNKLIDYSGTHLQRMVTLNPGALLNARITATTTALVALDNLMLDNETRLALRMARVQTKEAFREALPGHLARIHGAVVAAFGQDSPQLTECFPQGRTPFLKCPDDQLDDKLQSLAACLQPYAASVGQAHLDNLSGLISTWIALLAAVESSSANKSTSQASRNAARAALQLELFKNLLTLSMAFPNDEVKIKWYCPQHLLESHPAAAVPGATTLSISAFNPATRQATFHLTAERATTFTLQRRAHGDAEFADVVTDLTANEGAAIYEDTLSTPGQYEYQALATNAAGPGQPSTLLMLDAATPAAA